MTSGRRVRFHGHNISVYRQAFNTDKLSRLGVYHTAIAVISVCRMNVAPRVSDSSGMTSGVFRDYHAVRIRREGLADNLFPVLRE